MAWVGSMLAGLIGPLVLKKLLIFDWLVGENMAFFSSSFSYGEVAFELRLSLVSCDFILIPLEPSPSELVLFDCPIAGKF